MKITREQFEGAVLAAVERSNTGGEALITDASIEAALMTLGIEVEQEPAIDDEMIWVVRTWLDVREGDIVRPPGAFDYAAVASNIGPVNHWHAAPNASQYAPNESPAEWSSINVTLQPLAKPGDENGTLGIPYIPARGMRPDAGVEIRVTRAELAAIEACGGWHNRVGVTGA